MSYEGRLKFIGIVERSNQISKIKIFREFCDGLKGLEDFSHAIILYWFHLRDNEKHRSTLRAIPKRHPGAPEVGVFACRSPSRPNPIGFCIVKLLKVEKCTILVEGLDAFKGSPIIDVKPYIPRADFIPNAKAPEWAKHGPPT